MSTIDAIDCSSLAVQACPDPVSFECWGKRKLPATISFSAGPTVLISPNTVYTPNWPTSVLTGSLARGLFGGTLCGAVWSHMTAGGFTIIFNWAGYPVSQPVSCTINQASMVPNWVIGSAYSGINYTLKSGSCSQDPTTGIVTMNFATTIDDGLCKCPITLTYSG